MQKGIRFLLFSLNMDRSTRNPLEEKAATRESVLCGNKFHILSVDFSPADCYNSTAVEKEEYASHPHTERASHRLKVRSGAWLRKVALEAGR